ncbi:MAG: sugar transferase [Bacteroidales bacterium]|nr:sugar transferase [Bacteroidales bacterium]
MIKRLFDIFLSAFALILLFPVFIIVSLIIKFDSKGTVIYKQKRVGKKGRFFFIFKFRTMFTDADKLSLLTSGNNDRRITKSGYFLRKYKIDELPQLWNIFIGDMSFVGPRPETPNFVDLYTEEQRNVLSVRPGLTDYATLEYYSQEAAILQSESNPEYAYINIIMPAKLQLNLKYIKEKSLFTDLKIIINTFFKIIKADKA